MKRQIRSRKLLASYAIVIILAVIAATVDLAGERPSNLGTQNGKLAPCPASPNCVSSQAENLSQSIPPLLYNGTTAEAVRRLKEIVQSMNGTRVVTENANYIHVEFTVPILGFVDDVEFYFDETEHTIHMRSASRTGYWDLGVNRRRLETVARKWAASSGNQEQS
ncbi:DUF1499 domain-containing protein [bacterium]|nr:DUF1499 domain-containing protein [bacterium]